MIKRRLKKLEQKKPVHRWVAGDYSCRKDGRMIPCPWTIDLGDKPIIAEFWKDKKND